SGAPTEAEIAVEAGWDESRLDCKTDSRLAHRRASLLVATTATKFPGNCGVVKREISHSEEDTGVVLEHDDGVAEVDGASGVVLAVRREFSEFLEQYRRQRIPRKEKKISRAEGSNLEELEEGSVAGGAAGGRPDDAAEIDVDLWNRAAALICRYGSGFWARREGSSSKDPGKEAPGSCGCSTVARLNAE
ncbi:hypothetical protein B296_00024863, partial [Ensete ventricosum]